MCRSTIIKLSRLKTEFSPEIQLRVVGNALDINGTFVPKKSYIAQPLPDDNNEIVLTADRHTYFVKRIRLINKVAIERV